MPEHEDADVAPSGDASTDDEARPRRARFRPDVEMPRGYRSSKRGSKSVKQARKAMREQRILRVWDTTRRTTTNLLVVLGMAAAGIAAVALVLWGGASLVNSVARWNAKRVAMQAAPDERSEQARENLLVIGADDGEPVGFLATRYDERARQVYGVAIPEGAFIEVPGQGFERLGDSLAAGPDVSADAVSNYLGVPFERYVVVPGAAYEAALQNQSLDGVLDDSGETNMDDDEIAALRAAYADVPSANVALVPMPVKPIKLGDQTYFEPQRDEIADVLKTWWGVDVTDAGQMVRVIVYNGAGTPGIAGEAAQKLIRAGYRVVDTKNADRFDYEQTTIVVQRGDASVGEDVAAVLDAGTVEVVPSDQEVADVIVIVGQDFSPDE